MNPIQRLVLTPTGHVLLRACIVSIVVLVTRPALSQAGRSPLKRARDQSGDVATHEPHLGKCIGVVDVQKILTNTAQARSAKQELNQIYADRQKRLDSRQEELRGLKKRIESEQSPPTEASLRSKIDLYEQQFAALQREYEQYRAELKSREEARVRTIVEAIFVSVDKVREANGFSIIVEAHAVPAPEGQPEDVTALVMQDFEQRYGARPLSAVSSPLSKTLNPAPAIRSCAAIIDVDRALHELERRFQPARSDEHLFRLTVSSLLDEERNALRLRDGYDVVVDRKATLTMSVADVTDQLVDRVAKRYELVPKPSRLYRDDIPWR